MYIDKAAADVEAISGIVSDSLQALGKAPDAISEAEIKRFCQNAGKLCVYLPKFFYRPRLALFLPDWQSDSQSRDPAAGLCWRRPSMEGRLPRKRHGSLTSI